MTHYVCTGGCGGESETPKACDNPRCVKFTQPMTVCNCQDTQHRDAYEQPKPPALTQ